MQVFNIGAASVGTFGLPAGICAAAERFGRVPLAELVAPAVALAREGVELSRQQAYVIEILGRDRHLDAGGRGAVRARRAGCWRPGERLRQPELAGALEELAADGAEPVLPRRASRPRSSTGSASAAAC